MEIPKLWQTVAEHAISFNLLSRFDKEDYFGWKGHSKCYITQPRPSHFGKIHVLIFIYEWDGVMNKLKRRFHFSNSILLKVCDMRIPRHHYYLFVPLRVVNKYHRYWKIERWQLFIPDRYLSGNWSFFYLYHKLKWHYNVEDCWWHFI